jgi:hypothetical protein
MWCGRSLTTCRKNVSTKKSRQRKQLARSKSVLSCFLVGCLLDLNFDPKVEILAKFCRTKRRRSAMDSTI